MRLWATHADWTTRFLAEPTLLGVADTYGIEVIHPIRAGRSAEQIGKKGTSNHRWIVGAKRCFILNQFGLLVDWAGDTANVHDSTFRPLLAWYDTVMVILTDTGFHGKEGDPVNMKVCKRGTGNERMLGETVLAMLTGVCHSKRMHHRVWRYLRGRVAYLMALFNVLVQWHGVTRDEQGRVHLSLAELSL